MSSFKFLGLAIVFMLVSCKESQKEYYSDGSLKAEFFIENNVKNGQATTYYKNGSVESKLNYKNGLKHGEESFYYESGKIKSIVTWNNGQQSGLMQLYHQNGTTEYDAEFKNNQRVDTSFYYNSEGQLEEMKIYGRNGKVAYVLKYDENQVPTINSIIPILEYDSDTIQLGESVNFIVDFTFELEGKTGIELGYVSDEKELNRDTTFLLEKKETVISFTHRPKFQGLNRMYLKMLYDAKTGTDTIGLDGVIKTVNIFVISRST